jgi:murein DD-endopeptidase MepM/ murein hydrolase activator NlpD
MQYPVNFIGISQGYHTGKSIDFGWSSTHGGKTQPIYSIDDGVIYKIIKQYAGGNILYIKHNTGYVSEYAHLKDKSILFKVGQKVKKGQQVATMGNTGANSTGYHLHFSLYKNATIKDSNKLPCLDYLFVATGQIVGENTNKKYKLLKWGQTMTCTATKLRVRNKPSLLGKVVGYLYRGNQVKIYDRQNDFYKIGDNKYSSVNYLKGIQ